MHNPTTKPIRPRKLCLEASTVCQLKCPSCPTALGETGQHLGVGFLKFKDFKKIVDENPWLSTIELSNWGEVFLNKDLIKILEYAYTKNVALSAENGANLNHLPDATAEALVKYRFRKITCSIDGASPETYPLYRVNGNFQQVIEHVKTINRFKEKYNSPYPELLWQFIPFGHNEHEISTARSMARDLGMGFYLKLSWDDLYADSFSPVQDKELIRRETGLGVASRQEFREEQGKEYVLRTCCAYMWNSPQVNHDGRVLGCPINYWDDYGNAHEDGLANVLNNERMRYARGMLRGENEEREDIPCVKCKAYKGMKSTGNWLSEGDIEQEKRPSRRRIGLGNRIAGNALTSSLVRFGEKAVRALRRPKLYEGGPLAVGKRMAGKLGGLVGITWLPKLRSGVFSLDRPIEFEPGKGWKPIHLFRGYSRSVGDLSCHMSGLMSGQCPHPPHRHKEEEILMLLEGEIEIPLPDLFAGDGTATIRLKPGEFVYYPSFFAHTLTTISNEPARYVMFKWQDRDPTSGDGRSHSDRLGHLRYDSHSMLKEMGSGDGFRYRQVFGEPTEFLDSLGCHVSTLSPGGGYPAHADPYDVGIVVLKGKLETLGQAVPAGNLIYYAAGEPHGMSNPGDEEAEYLVFEFLGRPPFWTKLTDPSRWRRKIRSMVGKS